MKPSFEALGIILARGGSQGVPRKNIRLLAGRPLIWYSLEAAQKANLVQRLIVSTDDEEIAETARSLGAEVPFMRPVELARHDTPSLPVLQHAVAYLEETEGYKPDAVVALQPTSPLRTGADIDAGITKLVETGADMVISVCEAEHNPYWMKRLEGDRLENFMGEGPQYYRRQDLPPVYRLNGAVYVYRRQYFQDPNRKDLDIRGIVMPQERSVDIDAEIDMIIAEALINRLR